MVAKMKEKEQQRQQQANLANRNFKEVVSKKPLFVQYEERF
jgi:hypothetical protein